MKFVWSARAVQDLARARVYIARDNPRAAQSVIMTIFHYTERRLTQFPQSGRPGRVKGTLELVIPKLPYVIPYRLADDHVEILRVYHAARDWPDRF